MDTFLQLLLHLLLLWRIGICIGIGVLLALLLSAMIPSLPSGYFFGLVFVSATGGVIWQMAEASAASARQGQPPAKISLPVSLSSLAFVGGIWGLLLQAALGSIGALLTVAVSPWVLGPLFSKLAREPVSTRAKLVAAAAGLLGFGTAHAIIHVLAAGA